MPSRSMYCKLSPSLYRMRRVESLKSTPTLLSHSWYPSGSGETSESGQEAWDPGLEVGELSEEEPAAKKGKSLAESRGPGATRGRNLPRPYLSE